MITSFDFYKNVIEQLPGITFVKDKNFVYRFANQAMVAATGYQKDEIIGNKDFNFSWNHLAETITEQDKNALNGNSPFLIDTPTSRDGSKIVFVSQKKPFYGGGIKLLGIIGNGFYFHKENYKNIFIELAWHGFKLTDFITPIKKNTSFIYGNIEFNIKQARIVGHMLRGCSTKQIANKVFLSPRTMEKNIASVYQEVGSKNKNEFIEKAFNLGFIELMFMQ